MNWAFIDYENVRSLEAVDLASYQRVLIFCGPQNKTLKLDNLPAAGVSRIDVITVPTSSKNNVDFHLAFHLGQEHAQAPAGVSFHVISHDKGYQGLVSHLELLGRSCKLIEPVAGRKTAAKKTTGRKSAHSAEPQAATAAATKASAGKTVASKTAASKTGTTKENSGKTSANKTSSNKASSNKSDSGKTGKPTVTKVKIKAHNAAALSEAASKLFAQLQVTGSNRPKTKARVLSWLKSHVKSLHMAPEPLPESIFSEWQTAGMLSLTGSTVSYADA